jgi:integrase
VDVAIIESALATAPVAFLRVFGTGSKFRRIPIPDALARDIEACRGWCFPGRAGDGHAEHWWVQDHLRSMLAGGSPHTVRHYCDTNTCRRSRDLRAGQALLGHASLATIERYLAMDDDQLTAARLIWTE